jgi:hypothetical protein
MADARTHSGLLVHPSAVADAQPPRAEILPVRRLRLMTDMETAGELDKAVNAFLEGALKPGILSRSFVGIDRNEHLPGCWLLVYDELRVYALA